MSRIAIVTVTFSPGNYLQSFLESIPAASSQGAHVVMVDNGSRDGAPERAACEFGAELIYSGGNVGYGAGMNVGARRVRELRESGEVDADFFIISNPDVVFSPGSIDRMLEAARRHPRAGAVGPLIREPDGSVYPSARAVPSIVRGAGHALLGSVWKKNPWTKAYLDAEVMDQERPAGWLSGSCLLVRWDAFESIGGFDERYFMYLEDVDLGDRLGRAGWLNIFTPAAEITHAKGHSASKHPEITLRAHHESAYRFQADRHPGWRFWPLRVVLSVGLAVRLFVAIRLAGRK